jgi:hypothetical protein
MFWSPYGFHQGRGILLTVIMELKNLVKFMGRNLVKIIINIQIKIKIGIKIKLAFSCCSFDLSFYVIAHLYLKFFSVRMFVIVVTAVTADYVRLCLVPE